MKPFEPTPEADVCDKELTTPYQNASGVWLTTSLFLERRKTGAENGPLFTLKERTHRGCASLKQLYLSHNDPTEYEFAMAVFNSWEHWQFILQCKWFQPYITAWRAELEVKLRSEAFNNVRAQAKARPDLAKWIAEGKWKPSDAKPLRGRPSMAEVEAHVKKDAEFLKAVNDDASRLGLGKLNH